MIQVSPNYLKFRNYSFASSLIGIAWSSAAVNLENISFGSTASFSLNDKLIPCLLILVTITLNYLSTFEFMLQNKNTRRHKLIQDNFRIMILLALSNVVFLFYAYYYRSLETLLFIVILFFFFVLINFIFSFLNMFLTMPIVLLINRLKGKNSVASAALEAYVYSLLLTLALIFVIIFLLIFEVLNPLHFFPDEYAENLKKGLTPFSIFAIIIFPLLYYRDRIFFNKVFCNVPLWIEEKIYMGDVVHIRTVANPEHEDFRFNRHICKSVVVVPIEDIKDYEKYHHF